MKVKYLVHKKTKEFGEILVFPEGGYDLFTSDEPTTSINLKVSFEEYEIYIKERYPDVDLCDYEFKEFDLIEFGEVGADIRNKLSSQKNLVCLLERYFAEETTLEKAFELKKYIIKEMKQSKINIDYIADLL